MHDEDLVFYDIECFRWDSLVIFKDIGNNILGKFWNNRDRQQAEMHYEDPGYSGPLPGDLPSGFEDVYKVIEGKTLVGYNNYNYDDKILYRMLNPAMAMQRYIYATNNAIIQNNGGNLPKISNPSLDTMQQIDVSRPSLKQIEGNMGRNIKETDVRFDIERPLTDEERALTEYYCGYDVKNTIEVYKLRKSSYFEIKEALIKMLPEESQKNAMKWNTTTISAAILTGGRNSAIWTHHKIPDQFWNDDFREHSGIDQKVWSFWDEAVQSPEATLGTGKTIKQKTSFGTYVFGLGGLHGAPDKPIRCGRCKHKDVASMYPSGIVTLKALEDVETYDSIRKERISIKKTDPVRAGALKLVLNSVYGNFKNKYSTLFNPLASSTICIYGQIALFTLCKELAEAGYEIINANTDGVVYRDTVKSTEDQDEEICDEWEKTFKGYRLDTDIFNQWIQKDVNNYIAVEEDGKVTVKGGETNKYQKDLYFKNNNARVVQIVMVEKLLHPEKDVLDLLLSHTNDHHLWQFVLKAGSTFVGTQDKAGHYLQKVNRIFAAAPAQYRTLPATKLYKVKMVNGIEAQINYPDVPEEMILWNDDVDKLPDFEKNVGIQFYYDLVNKKLKGWPDVY